MSDFMFNLIIITIFLVSLFGTWLVVIAESLSDDFVIKGNKGYKKSYFRKIIDGLKAIINI